MKLGVSTMPASVSLALEVAGAADELGLDVFGLGEGPYLHHDVYVSATACLLATKRIPVGPFVTNPVTRNWVAHASTARTLDALAPGRFLFGVAPGDGAVHSVGLAPMPWLELADTVARIRERGPEQLPVHCTVSGPRGATIAGSFADCVVVATGADASAIRALGDRALSSTERGAAPEIWAMIPTMIVDDDDDVDAARNAMRSAAYATAHFAFAGTFEDKNVPEEHQDAIRACFAGYDYAFHGSHDAASPNLRAFDDHPELANYLQDRMCIVGTRAQVRARIEQLAAETGIVGLWVPSHSIAHVTALHESLRG